jgi:copper(I)-binding protein
MNYTAPRTLTFLAGLILLLGPVSVWAQHGIEIHEPWIREAPPNARVLAAYMELRNHSDKPRMLTSVTSPAFGFAELHQTTERDGMAHMEQIKEIVIPPNGKVVLGPGNLHIMLIDPNLQLKAGDTVSLTLGFRNDTSQKVIAKVRKAEGMSHGMHHHMNHDMNHNMHDDKDMHDMHDKDGMHDMHEKTDMDMHSDHHH